MIEAVGTVAGLEPAASGHRLTLETPLAAELTAGDSVAVNGVCLTAVSVRAERVSMDIGPETARVTTLGRLPVGRLVNLERPLRADSRLGGHFVQGHVDGVGRLERQQEDGDCVYLTYRLPPGFEAYVIARGAVAVDGISLTVVSVRAACFDVQIVPFTWTHTNLSQSGVGEEVNIECDLLGKYVVRAAELWQAERGVEP